MVEKILARGETVRADWPIAGLTGYEFADLAGGLLVDGPGAARVTAPGGADVAEPFGTVARRAKGEVLGSLLAGQLRRVARAAVSALESDGDRADVAVGAMVGAVAALTAELAVYRTYVDGSTPSTADRTEVERSADRARASLDAEGGRVLDLFCRGIVERAADSAHWRDVAVRWQQLSGAAAAKGVEDTALYRFDGLLAMAEVGSDPGSPAVSPSTFHRAMAARAEHAPGSLNATSTHDTKRAEDVRARLAVLSELPGPWRHAVGGWEDAQDGGVDLPSARDRAIAYQTVVGSLAADGSVTDGYVERLQDYLVKAAREAKVDTSWLEPDERYERSVRNFVTRLLGDGSCRFAEEAAAWVTAIGPAAATNALTLVTLRSTAPGVPDTYQGSETWAYNLVDPDNRRPVDFAALAGLLDGVAGVDEDGVAHLVQHWQDGAVKVHVTSRLLQLRRRYRRSFEHSGYRPLGVSGDRSDHVVAFVREGDGEPVVTVVPRLVYRLVGPGRFALGADAWGAVGIELGASLPGRWRDALTGRSLVATDGRLAAGDVLARLPVAVLVPD